jgi:tripartite-type tricarboxylate transporter receptor subunit TctC
VRCGAFFQHHLGMPMTGTPEQLGALLKKELARWQRVVAQAGIKPE